MDLNMIKAKFEQDLLALKKTEVQEILFSLKDDLTILETIDLLVTPVLENIGQKWENGEIALSQVYMSGVICEELIEQYLNKEQSENATECKVGIVTFQDYHALGKRIVYSLLRANGIQVKDYGSGLNVNDIIQIIRQDQIKILLISTLMYPSALNIKKIKQKIKSEKLNVKLIVGGAPFRFDKKLWKTVGADAMGTTASDAIHLTRKFLEELA